MGYDIWAHGEWDVPAEKGEAFAQALLRACAEQDDFGVGDGALEAWYEREEPSPDPRVSPVAYFNSRFDCVVGVEGYDDGSYKLFFTDDSFRNYEDEDWIFRAAAPFANEGDTIFFKGEDGYQWSWVVKDGALDEQDSETVYGQDTKDPEAVQKILEIVYPDGKYDPDFGQDHLGALYMIENILREAGFGPHAGMNELERLADV